MKRMGFWVWIMLAVLIGAAIFGVTRASAQETSPEYSQRLDDTAAIESEANIEYYDLSYSDEDAAVDADCRTSAVCQKQKADVKAMEEEELRKEEALKEEARKQHWWL